MIVNPFVYSAGGGGGSGDLDAYPGGLWAPTGLDKLLSAYGGDCVRLRRSSDDTTSEIGFASGVLDEAAALSFVGAANAYTYYDKVAVYLYVTGASGGTTFRDVKGHPCAAVADAKVSTALGFPTAIFDGTGDRIDITINDTVHFGTADFRIRCKVRATTLGVRVIAETYGGSAATSSFYLQLGNSSGRIDAGCYSGGSVIGACSSANGVISTGVTYDVSFERSGSTFTLFVDGVAVATATSASAVNDGPATLFVGGESGAASVSFNGHIWGLTIEPGAPGRTAGYTPDALYGIEGYGYVERLYFQDGSGAYFGQTTVGRQPLLVRNGAMNIDSSTLSAIEFDGTDDYLVSSVSSGTPTAMTVFLTGYLARFPATGGLDFLYQHSTDYTQHKSCFAGVQNDIQDGFTWGISDGVGNRISAAANNTTPPTTRGVVGGRFDKTLTTTAKRQLYYNGTAVTVASSSTTGTVGTSAFDALAWYLGGISATQSSRLLCRNFVIYETSLTDPTIAAISALL